MGSSESQETPSAPAPVPVPAPSPSVWVQQQAERAKILALFVLEEVGVPPHWLGPVSLLGAGYTVGLVSYWAYRGVRRAVSEPFPLSLPNTHPQTHARTQN